MRNWRGWLLFVGVALVVITLAYQFAAPLHIDVGERSADPFIEGFSFRESADFGGYRWSGAAATLSFRGIGNQSGVLRLKLGAPGGGVVVRVNGKEIGPGAIEGGEVREWAFTIERERLGASGDLLLTLESDTFTAPPDPRELGAQVVSAGFEPAGGLVFPAPLTLLYILLDLILGVAIVRAWSGSARLGWGFGVVFMIAIALGLAGNRLLTAWLVRVAFWLGAGVFLLGWAVVWLLRRFYPVETRTLRLLGLFVLLAFVVRLPLAVTPGFIVDVQDYVVWSYKLTWHGLGSAYRVVEGLWAADYPPVLLYPFWALGVVYKRLFAPDFLYPVTAGDPTLRLVTTNPALLADPIHRTLLRMPAIAADLVTGTLIFVLVRRRVSERGSYLLAACYWFNPAVIYNSALYGQTDAVHTLLVVLALALIETVRAGWGFLVLALAGLAKPQAWVFGPLLLLRAFQRQKWPGVVRGAVGGLAGVMLAAVPMVAAGALPGLLTHLGSAVGHHAVLSANAHNLWWFVMPRETGVEDAAIVFGTLSYRAVGLLLLVAAYGLALVSMVKHPRRDAWAVAAYVGFAFFVLPTEIHENYGFAVLVLLVVAMATEKRLAVPYAVLSLTSLANYALHDPNLYTLLALSAPDAQLAGVRWANAAVNVLVFAAWTVQQAVALAMSSRGREHSTGSQEKASNVL